MRNFYTWLENSNPILISYKKTENSLREIGNKLIDSVEEKNQKLKNFNPYHFIDYLKKELIEYPYLTNLLAALELKNYTHIINESSKLREWLWKSNSYLNNRDIIQKIYLYADFFRKRPQIDEFEKEIEDTIQKSLKETQINMEKIKINIENAIKSIENWNNSSVFIISSSAENDFSPSSSADVQLGNERFSPSFMIFLNDDKMIIDDVLEGGDDDFFKDNKIQSDYFNLINELRSPGSAKKSKLLTLYTARPVKDRDFYLSSQKLPTNIFLSNDKAHVSGIAHDLASDELRDVWKVKIDSKYLIQTLDSNNIKYYQVISDAPVKMELI